MFTFLLFVSVLVLVFWVASVSNRLARLEKQLSKGLQPSQTPQVQADAVKEPGFVQPRPAMAQMPAAIVEQKIKTPLTEAQQTEIATNWLNKIGVVAVLLGMVFFFKYAIDKGWINAWARIIIGFGVSGLLVFLGELWKEKYGTRAHALSGGGIALFYFTIFAGFQFYSLFAQPVAWVLMLLVAALSVYLAFRYSSLTLGLLAFVGAYGSPLMLSNGQDKQITWFVYLTVMNAVALVICLKKFWAELLFAAALGSGVVYWVWAASFSNQQNTFNSLPFLVINLILLGLGAAALLRYHHTKNTLVKFEEKNLSPFYLLLGGGYFVAIWSLLFANFHSMLPAISLLGSVTLFLAYAVVDRLEYRFLNYGMSFVASLLLVYAAVWQFDGKALAFALLAIALLGSTIGSFVKREDLRVWALIALCSSLLLSLFEPYGAGDQTFLFNAKFGLVFANVLGLLLVGWLYKESEVSKFEQGAEEALQAVAALVLCFAVSWEIVRYFRGYSSENARNLVLSLWWVVYAAILMGIGGALKLSAFRKVSIALFALGIVKVFIYDSQALDTPYRIIAFIVLGVILLSVSFSYRKNKEKIVQFIEGGEIKSEHE